MWPPDHTRGLSLVEVLVAAGLAMLLGLVLVRVLIPAMDATARRSTRIDLEQQANRAASLMARDLEASAPTAVSCLSLAPDADPQALALQRLDDVDASGGQLWEGELVVYAWSSEDRALTRRTVAAADLPFELETGRPHQLSAPEIQQVLASGRGRIAVLSRDVADFTLQSGDGSINVFTQPLQLQLELKRQSRPGVEESIQVERKVYLPNITR